MLEEPGDGGADTKPAAQVRVVEQRLYLARPIKCGNKRAAGIDVGFFRRAISPSTINGEINCGWLHLAQAINYLRQVIWTIESNQQNWFASRHLFADC